MQDEHIIILTGAGVSAASGIPTFRGAGGFWKNHNVMDLATPEGFAADPELVQAFYNTRRASLNSVEPNAAHVAIAKLQNQFSGRVTLVTQNVDDLHERAGSPDVIHMHGQLRSALCSECGMRAVWQDDLTLETRCPKCSAVGSLRPDVVWFGEMPYHMEVIMLAMETVTTFISVGTSGEVYPAANFLDAAKSYGAQTLEFNLEPSARSQEFDESNMGPAEDLLPEFVETVLRQQSVTGHSDD